MTSYTGLNEALKEGRVSYGNFERSFGELLEKRNNDLKEQVGKLREKKNCDLKEQGTSFGEL